jgi:hypothetical protein
MDAACSFQTLLSAYKTRPTCNPKEANANNQLRGSLNTFVRPVCFVSLCCHWIVNQPRTVTQPTLLIQIPNLYRYNVLITQVPRLVLSGPAFSLLCVRCEKRRRMYTAYSFRGYGCMPSWNHLICGDEDPKFLEASRRITLPSRNVSSNKK